MNKKEFLGKLTNPQNTTLDDKLQCCQFFIDNYPVAIDEGIKHGPMHIKTGERMWTQLQGITIINNNPMAVQQAFASLINRVDELVKFK